MTIENQMVTVASSLMVSDDLLSRLVLQRADEPRFDICAYYACANIFATYSLNPPNVDEMIETMHMVGLGHEEMVGIKGGEQIVLLHLFDFPFMVGAVSVPKTTSISSFVKGALESGCQLCLTVCFVVELMLEAAIALGDKDFAGVKVWTTHGVIPISVDDEGINVIVRKRERVRSNEISFCAICWRGHRRVRLD